MTTFYSSVGHHRRTSSLPVFDDPPSYSRAGGGGGFRGGLLEMKESFVHGRDQIASPRTPLTPRSNGDADDWSRRSLTTARSGEIIDRDSATLRQNTTTDSNDFFHSSQKGPSLHPTWTTPSRTTPLGSITSPSPTKTYHWSSTTSKVQGLEPRWSQSTLRSPAVTLDAGKVRGVPTAADLDDGGLSGWEDSFQKFLFSATTPSERLDDWKKDFFHQDEEQLISRSRSGSGTFGTRRDSTTLSRDGTASRNVGSQRGYVSDSEESSWNWLETQREKLASKRAATQNLSNPQRLDVGDRISRQSSEMERQLLSDLRGSQTSLRRRVSDNKSSEMEGQLLSDLRGSQTSLRRRASEGSDLRYRAKSMDNVGVNSGEYDVTYTKFGPSFQRKGSTLQRGWGSGTAERGLSGDGGGQMGGRAYQTLPRGARLQGNSSSVRERMGIGKNSYVARTLRPGEERFNGSVTAGGGSYTGSTGGFNSLQRQHIGDNSKRRQDKEEEEEITLRPIGPGVQPLESPDRSTKPYSVQTIDNYKTSSSVPAIALTPPTPAHTSISTFPPFPTTMNHSTKLNEPVPVYNTGTGSPSASRDFRSRSGDDEIVVEQAIPPGVSLPPGTTIQSESIRVGDPRGTFEVYRNQSPSRSTTFDVAQPKPLVSPIYSSSLRQGQPGQPGQHGQLGQLGQAGQFGQQHQQQQQQQQQLRQQEFGQQRMDADQGVTDPNGSYSGATNWQYGYSSMGYHGTQPDTRGDRTVPGSQGIPVKYQTIQHNQTSEDGPKRSEYLANQLGPRQLDNIQGHTSVEQSSNGQQTQQRIQQQMKELERQQLQLLQQQQQLQQQLEQIGMKITDIQPPQQLLRRQDRQQPEQQLLQVKPFQAQEQRSSTQQQQQQHGAPFQQQFVQQRTAHEQRNLQQPQLQEQHGNFVQQQQQQHTQNVQPVVQMVPSRDNRLQPQQQQQQHYETVYSHDYLQPVVQPIVRHVPSSNNQALKPLKGNPPLSQNLQSSISPLPPHGMYISSETVPFQVSTSQTQKDFPSNLPGTPQSFQSPSSVIIHRQESEPVSPTGGTPQSQGCTMEIVHPTYCEVPNNNINITQSNSITSSGPRSYSQMNHPLYATVNKTSGDLCSNGPLTLGAEAASMNQRYHDARAHPTVTPQGSFASSAFVGVQNLANQPRAILTSHFDGAGTGGSGGSGGGSGGGGGVGISPEAYWIQQARADRNNMSMVSSAGSSSASHVTPLTVDVYRIQRWTDANNGHPHPHHLLQGQSSPSNYADRSSGGSLASSRDGQMESSIQPSANFVKDMSHLWYKPHLNRDEVINALKQGPVGSFLVRDSNTYPGSFALAVKVETVPANAPLQKYSDGDASEELVRHFLIEPTPTGVRLKGYKNESVFGSLAALIYQHSITPLSLPCRLRLPASDVSPKDVSWSSSEQPSSPNDRIVYCAFNVLYLKTIGVELLTGPVALERTTTLTLDESSLKTTIVNLKVTSAGVTLTDNNRSVFFRRHFPAELIRYCGLDRRLRSCTYQNESTGQIAKHKIFGIVSRRSGLSVENECHLFAELDSTQSPSSTIISFVNQIIQERHSISGSV